MADRLIEQQAGVDVQRRTKKTLLLLSLKRTFDLFAGNHGQRIPPDENSQRLKLACKVRSYVSGASRDASLFLLK